MRKILFLACVALSMLVSGTRAAAQSADDKTMAQQIGSQLKESGQLHNYRIGVKYKDGVAWLSGTVTSMEQMSLAMRLTQHMNGVDHVVNDLSVAGATPASNGAPLDLGGSLHQASQPSARANRPQVNQAYLPAGRLAGPANGSMPRRSNMPVPMRSMQPMPVQQAMYGPTQASCPCNGPRGMGPRGIDGGMMDGGGMMEQGPVPAGYVPGGGGGRGANYDNAQMPGYAWPSYASYPNYAAVTYPQQYSPTAWPYIGPFYPYPQVPLGWRKVALEWDDGWWFLDFSDCGSNH